MQITIKNLPAEKTRLRLALERFAAGHKVPANVVLALDLALEELVTNILHYAYTDPSEHEIVVRFKATPTAIRIDVEDDGRPFDPSSYPVPQINLSLDEKPIGGLGIHMARKSMDAFEYARIHGRNHITLVKRI